MMGNLKNGRHDFRHFEVPEDLTLCHEEAHHPERIKLWYELYCATTRKVSGSPASSEHADCESILLCNVMKGF